MGIPIGEFSPSRGKAGASNDKRVRLSAVSDLFASGRVWAPDTRWAREVIEEVAAFPAGEHDDYVDTCFVGDTQVLLFNGTTKCIKDVRVGEFVATPEGPCRVTAVLDRGEREIWELEAGGHSVFATPDHRMMTARGWTRIDSLVPLMDTVVQANQRSDTCRLSKTPTSLSKRLFLMGARIAGIQTVKTPRIDAILGALVGRYIAIFGSSITGLYQKGITYTTSTVTRWITALKILSAYPQYNIGTSTNTGCPSAVAPMPIKRTSTVFGTQQRHGTEAKKAVHGTEKTHGRPWHWRTLLRKQKAPQTSMLHASGAAGVLLPIASARLFVLPNAKQPNQSFALVSRVRNTHTTQRVYDLTVEQAHCFYANGLLAHNCTQALMRMRQGGFIRLPSDMPEDPPQFRSARRAAYY